MTLAEQYRKAIKRLVDQIEDEQALCRMYTIAKIQSEKQETKA